MSSVWSNRPSGCAFRTEKYDEQFTRFKNASFFTTKLLFHPRTVLVIIYYNEINNNNNNTLRLLYLLRFNFCPSFFLFFFFLLPRFQFSPLFKVKGALSPLLQGTVAVRDEMLLVSCKIIIASRIHLKLLKHLIEAEDVRSQMTLLPPIPTTFFHPPPKNPHSIATHFHAAKASGRIMIMRWLL